MPELYQGMELKEPDGKTRNKYCKECRKSFITRFLYRIHLDLIHDIKEGESEVAKKVLAHLDQIPNVDDPNNHCTPCDKTSSSKHLYHIHLVKCHDMKLLPLPSKPIKKNEPLIIDPMNIYCNVCDKTYQFKKKYREHIVFNHNLDYGPVPYKFINIDCNEKPIINKVNFYCTYWVSHKVC